MDKPLGFFDLPVEIIDDIIGWLAGPHPPSVPHTYHLNHVRLQSSYSDLLSLSSTCTYLRRVAGPYLFQSVSFIRHNQLDVTVSNPKSLEQFSDGKKYHRLFIRELLDRNFQDCSKEYLAKSSFKVAVNGESSLRSRYKLFSINNYITYLECDNALLKGRALELFPNLTDLKVLDNGLNDKISLLALDRLGYLSINAKTWFNLDHTKPLNIRRLDLFMDINELDPNISWSVTIRPLRELNIFVNRANVVLYTAFVNLLNEICHYSKELANINLRVFKESFLNDTVWKVDRNPIKAYINMFKQLNLQHLGIEETILHQLRGTGDIISAPQGLCMTIIDPTVNTPRLNRESCRTVCSLVLGLGATSLKLAYGEVLDQSHIQALNLMTDLVQYITSHQCNYQGITQIGLEKCWSVSDDTIMIDYYVSELRAPTALTMAKFSRAAPWVRTKFNSPRYRIPETFLVNYEPFPSLKPNYKSVFAGPLTSQSFWSVEASLLEMQQYSMERSVRSSIWD